MQKEKKVLGKLQRSMIMQQLENELTQRIDDEMYDLYKFLVKKPRKYDLVQIHYDRTSMVYEALDELAKLTDDQLYNLYNFLDEQELIEAMF